jgi:hypothetical protein
MRLVEINIPSNWKLESNLNSIKITFPNGFCGYEVKKGFKNTLKFKQPQNPLG